MGSLICQPCSRLLFVVQLAAAARVAQSSSSSSSVPHKRNNVRQNECGFGIWTVMATDSGRLGFFVRAAAYAGLPLFLPEAVLSRPYPIPFMCAAQKEKARRSNVATLKRRQEFCVSRRSYKTQRIAKRHWSEKESERASGRPLNNAKNLCLLMDGQA
jgi:hypothetical protein